jgi:photosystem II stability/assembly factor-like uncharacterized protein
LFVDGNRAWTWEARNTGLSAWSVLDIARGIDGTLYVGTQAGVLASTDEGASFTHSTDGMVFTSEVREVVPHPDDAGIVFLAGRFLWRSDDRGRTWTEVHRPGAEDGWTITSLTVVAEGILAGTGNRLLLFDGTPSEPISVGPNVPRPGGPSDVVDPQAILRVGPSLAIVTTPSGVYSTTDGGATFTAHSDGLPPSPDCRNVVATASGRFVLRVDRDAYTADSLGATWTRAEVGGRVLHLSAAGDNVLAVLDVGVAISRDAGRTWTTRSDLSAFFPKSGMVEPDGSTLLGTGGFGLWRSVP